MPKYDAIIVGAGSIGVPTALALGEAGIRTLVLDGRSSPGQGENKHAIGGIRATHSDPAKIIACMASIDLFASWKDRYGDDIEWLQGGYLFPVYRQQEETVLKSFLPVQKRFGLEIDYVDAETVSRVVPGIALPGLRGGSWSPRDGSASPLMAVNAFCRRAATLGCDFRFKERAEKILVEKGRVCGVETNTGRYDAPVVIDAAGALSPEIAATVGTTLPVMPESHEAAITEPVQRFFSAMVVDIRPAPGSLNYYFYQSLHGQVVFCITPDPPIPGHDYRETSVFLPQVAKRMVALLPRLRHLRVRRVWRGLYPMTPDGSPLVGWNREVSGLLHATGMCGQGFMLGPGLGQVVARMVTRESVADDDVVLDSFSPYRDFGKMEALK